MYSKLLEYAREAEPEHYRAIFSGEKLVAEVDEKLSQDELRQLLVKAGVPQSKIRQALQKMDDEGIFSVEMVEGLHKEGKLERAIGIGYASLIKKVIEMPNFKNVSANSVPQKCEELEKLMEVPKLVQCGAGTMDCKGELVYEHRISLNQEIRCNGCDKQTQCCAG